MMCGRNGELVPSGECSNPMQGGPPCPLVHCEVPITLPPVIIDDQVFCCEAIIAECEACKAGMTVEEFCKQNPKMQGCEPSGFCMEQECGVPCENSELGKERGTCDFSPVKCEIGICECGKPCKLDGGMAGTCQPDGVTCSLTREMPVCRDDIIFPIHGCEIVDLEGNCLEQCFGGFAIAVSRDENGNTEEICGCSGDQCHVNPCDECKAKADAEGAETYTCPC